MGISKGALSLLFELKTTETLSGTVCQLGRQETYVSEAQVEKIQKDFGFLSDNSNQKKFSGVVNDEYLFHSLGFDSVESIDIDDYESATHMLNLNNDVPDIFFERFDVIYDGGTLEHIFNFPNCLKNIYRMLKPGGMIIHHLPCNNWVDHGFYQFSPTLFNDYYSANNWTILRSNIIEHTVNHDYEPWLVYKYEPGSIDHLSFGGWGKNCLGIWFVARKNLDSTSDQTPMQGSYINTWSKKSEIKHKDHLSLLKRIVRTNKYLYAILSLLKRIVRTNKYLYAIKLRLFRVLFSSRRKFRKPKVIAKY
jgi:SAM-dependent methyltransferase